MSDLNTARLQAHHSNIRRYRALLTTALSEMEREFIVRRLKQEQAAADSLVGSPPPYAIAMSGRPVDAMP